MMSIVSNTWPWKRSNRVYLVEVRSTASSLWRKWKKNDAALMVLQSFNLRNGRGMKTDL
jgi:hypothetical protein